MIIYENTKMLFDEDVKHNLISDKIKKQLVDKGISGGNFAEINSWINSLNHMRNILDTSNIAEDTYIAIEYKLPYSMKRIDFMIAGYDLENKKNVIIIELKQWTQASITDKNDYVKTFVGQKVREVQHPSYQAKTYEYLLSSFVEVIHNRHILCHSCSYLHNAEKNKNIQLVNINLYSYIEECPIFFKEDYDKLQQRISKLVGKGKGKEILYEVENSEVVPSQKLMNIVDNILKTNDKFLLVDSQKAVYENIMSKVNEVNNVFIINGNPGTGKSVVAINLLASLINKKRNTVFVAPNASFRNVLKEMLKKYNKKNPKEKIVLDVLFKGSGIFYNMDKDALDWLIVDEAHRLKSTAYMYKGKNQIDDIIKVAKNVVFFVDEKQVIRTNDIGTNKNIREIAYKYNKNVYEGDEFKLETQFRCVGANGYINALDTVLQLEETANFYLNEDLSYEVKICDTPQELENLINQKIKEGYTNSRIVAGFAWEWKTKNMSLDELCFNKDIVIEEHDYSLAWNYNDPNGLWAIRDDGITQAGCIHTCQGLEFDYCGVIIGDDLSIDENNNLYGVYDNYKDVAGKQGLKNNPSELTRMIKNIYKILLSRGQKGTYIFIRNKRLREYFKKHMKHRD